MLTTELLKYSNTRIQECYDSGNYSEDVINTLRTTIEGVFNYLDYNNIEQVTYFDIEHDIENKLNINIDDLKYDLYLYFDNTYVMSDDHYQGNWLAGTFDLHNLSNLLDKVFK